MKKLATLLLIALTLAGLTAAGHTNTANQPSATNDAGPDQTNTGHSDTPAGNQTHATNQTGPKNRMKGLSKAVTKAPGQIADTVLNPIQDLNPGKTLGGFLSGVNSFFDQQIDTNQTQ